MSRFMPTRLIPKNPGQFASKKVASAVAESRSDQIVAARFTDVQLSMVLSALAGDQSLCCDKHAPNRESIADTPEQLAALAAWADRHTGCRLGEGLINPAEWKVAARQRYLDNVKHLEATARNEGRS